MNSRYGYELNQTEENRYYRPKRVFIFWIIFPVVILAVIAVVALFFPEVYGKRGRGMLTNSSAQGSASSLGEQGIDADDVLNGSGAGLLEGQDGNNSITQAVTSDWNVMTMKETDGAEDIFISLPIAVRNDSISIENHYRDRALLIRIKGVKGTDFLGAFVDGNIGDIVVAAWREKDGEILISLQMNDVWEYEVSQDNGKLCISHYSAAEKYDVIVVVDPIDTRVNESDADITALLAEKLAQLAAAEGIKVYSTRGNAGNRTEAERLALMVDVRPAFVIELNADRNTDSEVYGMGARYDSSFYLPGRDNVSLAECILRNAATEACDRALYLDELEGDELIKMTNMSTASLSIGHLSNAKELELLISEDYRAKLATGIISGIKEWMKK